MDETNLDPPDQRRIASRVSFSRLARRLLRAVDGPQRALIACQAGDACRVEDTSGTRYLAPNGSA